MRNTYKDIYFLSICLVIITLPYSFLANNVAIILLIISWFILLLNGDKSDFLQAFRTNPVASILIIFALFYGFSALIKPAESEGLLEALRTLESKTAFIIFPLTLTGIKLLSSWRIKQLFKVYVITIIVATGLCLLIALFESFRTGSIYYTNPVNGVIENNFTYHRLSSFIGIHAIYLATYTSLAFYIVLIRLLRKKDGVKKKMLEFILLIYFALVILLLKSITISISFMLILGIFSVYYLVRIVKLSKLKLIILVFVSSSLVVLFSAMIIYKTDVKESLLEYDMQDNPPRGNWNALNLRLAKWDVAAQIISNHWVLGVGPGNLEETLDIYYEQNSFKFALLHHFNPHNQFFNTFIVTGIIGFIILILLFWSLFKIAFAKNDLIMLMFLGTFLLFSLSESTLVVNKGIVYFGFLCCIFSYLPENSSKLLMNENQR